VDFLGFNCVLLLREVGDLDGLGNGERGPVELDSFDFVHRFGGHVTLAAVWATNDRDILYYQQVAALPKASSYVPDNHFGRSANIANLTSHRYL
jgi:hypothetical protein